MKQGYVKLDDVFDSPCVPKENCTIPECPVNEFFDRCNNDCYATCDLESPVCNNNCTATCNCIEGYVRSSDAPDAECIPKDECKFIVDLTCGANEVSSNCVDPCHDICENSRLDTNRTGTINKNLEMCASRSVLNEKFM